MFGVSFIHISMKKILALLFITLACSSHSYAATYDGLSDARALAEQGIIVNQSTMSPVSNPSLTTDVQEASMYRLYDTIIRQEVLGIALKLRWIQLSDSYSCRNYYRDTTEWWVCRAAELSADYDIVTRANLNFRPHDTLTLAEALGITIKALNINLSTTPTSTISGTLPDWQKRLVLTIQENQISLDVRDSSGQWIALYDPRIGGAVSGFDMSHRLTRGQFFQILTAFLAYRDNLNPVAHCTVYNDGCNDCTVINGVPACTERACFWQGIPSCSVCESGYTLENNRCVKKQTSCIGLWGVVSNYSLPPEYQTTGICCSWLTSIWSREEMIVGAPNICANVGDGICDARYESGYNSSDCRTGVAFDTSICQNYYDGCNSCSRTENGQTICTLMACFVNWPAYCTSYVSYVPKNQTDDSLFIAKAVTEMRNYTKDLSCTTNAQCQWSMVGQKACGGPSAAIAFSTKNVDINLVTSKGTYITNAEKKFNETYGIMSDCMLIQPPAQLSCVNGTCQ